MSQQDDHPFGSTAGPAQPAETTTAIPSQLASARDWTIFLLDELRHAKAEVPVRERANKPQSPSAIHISSVLPEVLRLLLNDEMYGQASATAIALAQYRLHRNRHSSTASAVVLDRWSKALKQCRSFGVQRCYEVVKELGGDVFADGGMAPYTPRILERVVEDVLLVAAFEALECNGKYRPRSQGDHLYERISESEDFKLAASDVNVKDLHSGLAEILDTDLEILRAEVLLEFRDAESNPVGSAPSPSKPDYANALRRLPSLLEKFNSGLERLLAGGTGNPPDREHREEAENPDLSTMTTEQLGAAHQAAEWANSRGSQDEAKPATGEHREPATEGAKESAWLPGAQSIASADGIWYAPGHAPPSNPAEAVIFALGNRQYKIANDSPIVVEENEDSVLQAFQEQSTMDGPSLIIKAGFDRAPRVLKSLKTKYNGRFASAIRTPGKKGQGGYHVSIRRHSP
jgi:hypothetical protein